MPPQRRDRYSQISLVLCALLPRLELVLDLVVASCPLRRFSPGVMHPSRHGDSTIVRSQNSGAGANVL